MFKIHLISQPIALNIKNIILCLILCALMFRVSVGSGCSTILPCAKPSPILLGDNTWIQKKIYLRPQHRGRIDKSNS